MEITMRLNVSKLSELDDCLPNLRRALPPLVALSRIIPFEKQCLTPALQSNLLRPEENFSAFAGV
jgi:hypothetical protein